MLKPKYEYKDGEIYNCDCVELMEKMASTDGLKVDLIITSPPYDKLRSYGGEDEWSFDKFKRISDLIPRVMADGGVLVWVVGDATVNGGETLSSFRQALYFVEECGLRLHDTMIYEKNSSSFPANRNGNRYTQIFEYMFVFSKGKPKTANLICDKPNKWAGHTSWGDQIIYKADGTRENHGKVRPVPDFSPRNNIWKYNTALNGRKGHPAQFPDQLAIDHILTWTNPGDIVFDPMVGSGTSAIAAIRTGRNFIGCDICADYCDICDKYITQEYKTGKK